MTHGGLWSRNGEPFATVLYTLDLDAPAIDLVYGWRNDVGAQERVTESIDLESLPMPNGGARWWARCPMCSQRVAVIYLPPGAKCFACRACYNLTYRSAQKHDPRTSLLRKPGMMEAWMSSPSFRRRLFAGGVALDMAGLTQRRG